MKISSQPNKETTHKNFPTSGNIINFQKVRIQLYLSGIYLNHHLESTLHIPRMHYKSTSPTQTADTYYPLLHFEQQRSQWKSCYCQRNEVHTSDVNVKFKGQQLIHAAFIFWQLQVWNIAICDQCIV